MEYEGACDQEKTLSFNNLEHIYTPLEK